MLLIAVISIWVGSTKLSYLPKVLVYQSIWLQVEFQAPALELFFLWGLQNGPRNFLCMKFPELGSPMPYCFCCVLFYFFICTPSLVSAELCAEQGWLSLLFGKIGSGHLRKCLSVDISGPFDE